MADPQKLFDAILNGDWKTSVAATQEALTQGVDPMELVTNYMIPAMDEVGRLFSREEYFVPELLLAGRAMKGALELLRPRLATAGAEPAGRVVIGTVKGDLHDIGKNLVATMIEGGGFEVVDLGTDVSPEQFLSAAQQHNADVVFLSALLTVTMPAMKAVIEAFQKAGFRDRVKVMVGGAPVTQQYADRIGADAYAKDASVAVAYARRLVGLGLGVSYRLARNRSACCTASEGPGFGKVNCFDAPDRLRLQGNLRDPAGAHRGGCGGRREARRSAV